MEATLIEDIQGKVSSSRAVRENESVQWKSLDGKGYKQYNFNAFWY